MNYVHLVHRCWIYVIYEELIQTRSLQYVCFIVCALCICIQTPQYAFLIAAVLIATVIELILDTNCFKSSPFPVL